MLKRKVVTKNVPPDVSAVKLLKELDGGFEDYKKLTDEELENEKIRLINLIVEEENESGKN